MVYIITLLVCGSLIYLWYVLTNVQYPKEAMEYLEQHTSVDYTNDDISKLIRFYSILRELQELYTCRRRHIFVALFYFVLNIGTATWIGWYDTFPMALQVLSAMVSAAMMVIVNNIRLQNHKIMTAITTKIV